MTGICGTDFALASGEIGPTKNILGHEGVGRVVKLGSALSSSQIEVGQRVGIAWVRDICGTCAFCTSDGGETRCVEQMNSGRKVDGTFAEYTVVPYRYVLRLPEGPSDELIAPILCGGVTIYKALKICDAHGGQWVAIPGAGGGVGALGIQYARAMGFRVVAIDMGEDKREFCMKSGAEVYINLTKEDPGAAVRAATRSRGAQAVLVTAGSGRAYQDALGMLAPFGTLVCIGIPPPSQHVHFHPLTFIDNGYKIIGSAVGTRGDILEAIEFLTRGVVVPQIHMTSLEKLTDVAEEFQGGKVWRIFN